MQRLLHYQLIRKLGSGGMGEVFLARDTRLERDVALKVLAAKLAEDPLQRKRFLREARTASALSHPNICVVHEVGETDDGRPYLAIEYIDGETLDKRLQRRSPTIAETVHTLLQVADALDAAHARGVVHRDIKPSNIALTKRGQIKLLDFGLAKWAGESPSESLVTSLTTQPGVVIGTPAYMSPEQALGHDVDSRTDIFSAGLVLYEMVTGRLPFHAETFGEMVHKIADGRFEPMARFNNDVPPELERIARKCLARDPDRRFQSARELVVDLESLKRGLDLGDDALTGKSGAFVAPQPPQAGSAPGALHKTAVFAPADTNGGAALAQAIDHSDVLITYASLDDQPIAIGQEGWISQFHRNLELRVAQLYGQPIRVWRQADMAHLFDAIVQQIPQAKTCISVVSPPFMRSDGCRRIVKVFWQSAEESDLLEVDHHSRIVKVVKTPITDSEIPPELNPLFARLPSFDFYDRDPQSGRVREFDASFGEAARQRFYERVYDVAYDVSHVLKHFDVSAAGAAQQTGKRIFLAAATSDLERERDQLRRELTELGHTVLPKQPLPLVASELTAIVRNCLERCDLALHLVGEHYGFVPEASELSIVALQNQVAARHCAQHNLSRLIWLPKGLAPRDERQAQFVRQLERDAEAHRGAEVVIDSLENLKVLLRSRLVDRPPAARPAATSHGDQPPRLYLICDRQDEHAVEPLEDFFHEQGIDVCLPGFDADESEVQNVHIQNLRDCDAALVYYGAAGMHWVDFNVRDLQKAVGYRDARPIAVKSVYLAPPFSRRKERFKSLICDVICQTGEAFDPAALAEFVARVRTARGAPA